MVAGPILINDIFKIKRGLVRCLSHFKVAFSVTLKKPPLDFLNEILSRPFHLRVVNSCL